MYERGMHLIVDAYDCSGSLMSDRPGIIGWLNNLPSRIGMRILHPAIAKCDGPPLCSPVDAGITGFLLLAESHVSIHTWTERAELQFDLYSCRPFDAEIVLASLVHDFGIGSYDTELVERRRR